MRTAPPRKDGEVMAHTPYGYIIKGGKAETDTIKALQVKTLFEEYVAGSSLQAAGVKSGIQKAHSSLGRIIDMPCYRGDDFYPAIVSNELWNKAREERKRRADSLGRNKNYFADDKTDISPFWGKVFCKECGQEYRLYSEHGKERWRCRQRKIGRKVYCNSPMIFEHEFEETFMSVLSSIDIESIAVKPPEKPINIEKKYDDPFKQAEYAYSLTQIDDFEYQTDKLVNILKSAPTRFDGEFMKQVIKRIEVSHCGEISIILINDKTCKEAINHGNITANEDVGYTGKTENTDTPK